MDLTENLDYTQFKIERADHFIKNSTFINNFDTGELAEDLAAEVPLCGIASPSMSIASPPANTIISSQEHCFRPISGPKDVFYCGSCSEKSNAISYCDSCTEYLCSLCDFAHKKMKSFQNHRTRLLDTIQKLQDGDENTTNNCASHKSLSNRFFCWTCRQFLCSICVSNNHSSHKYEPISEAEQSLRNCIFEMVSKSQQKMSAMNIKSTLLKELSVKIQQQMKIAQNQIDTSYATLLDALNRIRYENLTKLEDINLNVSKKLETTGGLLAQLQNIQELGANLPSTANMNELQRVEHQVAVELAKVIFDDTLVDDISIVFESSTADHQELIAGIFGTLKITQKSALMAERSDSESSANQLFSRSLANLPSMPSNELMNYFSPPSTIIPDIPTPDVTPNVSPANHENTAYMESILTDDESTSDMHMSSF